MKRILGMALALTLACMGTAMAADLEATVQSVDVAGKEVSLDNGQKLVLDDTTTITMEGKEGKLEDLKTGSKVKASYEEKDGKNVASKIEVEQ
jgi:Cu/Ag efflux protein CusF